MDASRLATHIKKVVRLGGTNLEIYLVQSDGSQGDLVESWEVEAPDPKELAEAVLDAAQCDVDERGGSLSRRYNVTATDSAGTRVHQWTQRHYPKSQESTDSGHDELTGNGGVELVSLALRHSERQFTAVMSAQERVMRNLECQNEAYQKRIAVLEAREHKVTELARELLTRPQDGGADDVRQQRIDKAMQLILGEFVPAVGRHMGLLPDNFKVESDE